MALMRSRACVMFSVVSTNEDPSQTFTAPGVAGLTWGAGGLGCLAGAVLGVAGYGDRPQPRHVVEVVLHHCPRISGNTRRTTDTKCQRASSWRPLSPHCTATVSARSSCSAGSQTLGVTVGGLGSG